MNDYIVRATAADHSIRAFAITSKNIVEEARKDHNTSPVITAALGRLLSGAAMMGTMMKGEKDLLTVQIQCQGPAQGLTVTADSAGHVKGFPRVADVELPPNAMGKLDVGGALGLGVMSVIKDMGLKEPYVGQIALQTGEIAEDLTYYFATSEQIPSAVGLGVLVDVDGSVKQAGGFIIQLMPFTPDEVVDALEKKISEIKSVTEMLEEGNTPDPVKVYDGQYYVEYSVAHNRINKRFYWDSNENVLLYTLPGGSVSAAVGSKEYTDITEKKSEDYVILKTEGKIAYIALPFIQQYTNMEYEVYDDPTRVVITTEWGEKKVASIKRDTQVRYQGGVKSPVLTEVKKSDKVTVLEDENDWMKVATKDGFIGYVKTNALNSVEKELVSRDYEEPEYTNISENYTINMAWHNVSNADANSYILETIASTKGLNTIAPTWFSLADTEGNITSLADADYVNYAHQSNLEVWAVLRDFHGGINSYEESAELYVEAGKTDQSSYIKSAGD